jgi:peptidoglycan hydrolase-like protein with peptidoglycan-binding domain
MKSSSLRSTCRRAWPAVAVLVLAACGSSDDNGSGATTTGAGGSTTAAAVTTAATTAPATTASTAPATTTAQYTAEPTSGSLRQGHQGARVMLLQKQLTALGYDPGPADGKFGARTASAVQKLQTAESLAADGVVGPQTQAKIDQLCQAKEGCPKA